MKNFLFFLPVLFLFACSNIEKVEVKDASGNVVERYSRRKNDFAKEGKFEKFTADGKRIEEAIYINDTLQRQRTLFYENGQPQYIENYVNGQFDGVYRAFYESGKLKLEGHYVAGEMAGEWKGYYENGQLKEVVRFENNAENGPFVEYHENGKLAAEGSYLDGDHEHGELKLYDENGELKRTMMCDKGLCRTTWRRDSTQVDQ